MLTESESAVFWQIHFSHSKWEYNYEVILLKIRRRVSIRLYLYSLFIFAIIFAAMSTLIISYRTSISQLNNYYDITAKQNAKNVSDVIDGDYVRNLRTVVESEEYQAIRTEAEEVNDESIIQSYLEEQGLWEEFSKIRTHLTDYLGNITTIKYLYVIAYGGIDADQDMYLIDDETNALFEIGYYEQREAEFEGKDLQNLEHSVLNHSTTWGWLYSNYAPVYDSNGNCVALVGCDIELTQVLAERRKLLLLMIGWIVLLTAGFIIASLFIINRLMVKPLKRISDKVKDFVPHEGITRDDENILLTDGFKTIEMTDMAESIRTLELAIVDYVTNLSIKDRQISQLNKLSTKDSLTGVGNVHAYKAAMGELGVDIKSSAFSMLMADINNLKVINDTFGHKEGDKYIQNCCKILCDTFKHSSVFRIGGDEFVVLVQNEDFIERHTLYAKLKLTFDSNFYNEDIPLNKRYSMSIGMGDKRDDDVTLDRMFRDADRMMYDNKRRLKDIDVQSLSS